MQLTHYTSTFKKKTYPITVLCENVSNAPNIGSLFRTCDTFGVEKLVFSGEALPIPSRKMQKTSRATEKYVSYEIINDIHQYIESVKDTHHIIAIEITEKSKPLHLQKFNTNKPIVLIIGDENFGVSEAVLSQTNEIVHISMFGENSSMNVVQATTISLYEITKQLQETV